MPPRRALWLLLLVFLLQACAASSAAGSNPEAALLASAAARAAAGRRTAAEALYRDALAMVPGDPAPALALADLYRDWGRTTDALAALDTAEARGAADADLMPRRLALLAGAGQWDGVLALTDQVLAQAPDDATARAAALGAHLHGMACAEAEADAAALLATDPDNALAGRALALLQRDYEVLPDVAPDLLADLVGAATLVPGATPAADATSCDARCDGAIAEQLIRRGEWGLAGCVLSRVVAASPDAAEPHAWLGEALSRAGRTEEARAQFEEAVTRDPESPLAWLLLGKHALSSGDLEVARVGLLNAQRLDPENPAPCLALAELKAAAGRYDEVDRWIDAAVDRAPGNADVWKSAARFYLARSLAAETHPLDLARRAAELAPDDAEAQTLLGWSWLVAGDLSQALTAFDRALALDPAAAEAYALRARALQAAGDTVAAQADRLRAADLGYPAAP